MKIVSRVLAPLLLVAALPAAAALAEVGEGGQHGFNAEMRSRMEDGRLAMVKTALKLSDAQTKLWAPVEDMIRQAAAERREHRHEWRRGEGGEAGADRAEAALPDRLDTASARLTEQAAKMKAFASALRPLYDSFSPEQKQIAGPLLAELVGRRHGHGDGERHHGHHGHGGGGWRHDGGDGHQGGGTDRGDMDRGGDGPDEGQGPDKG
jgi:LTXXQ motif family protein